MNLIRPSRFDCSQMQPVEWDFRHSELELVVDGVEGCRQIESDQDSDLLVKTAVKTPSRTSSRSMECSFLYADWN